jgi:surface protein
MNDKLITKEELKDKILNNEDISGIDYSHITNMFNMFSGCSSLKEVPLLDTSEVKNMDSMFFKCSSLEEVPKLDTSKVTDMSNMFNGCKSLKTIPFADKIKDLEATQLPFLKELETLPDVVKVKLLMDNSDFKDKKIQAMIKLYKD